MKEPGYLPGSVLKDARLDAGLSVREVARRAGTSHATLLAYENGRKVPGIATFIRILEACGFAVNFDLERRIRDADGIPRGEELEEVLALAEQFPAMMPKEMDYPRFGRAHG
jgi:transcriptional regulator with XRE-family HTH domain